MDGNDAVHGDAGDDLLKAIGQLIRSTIRGEDVGFRCGGDEFVVLLPGSAAESGRALADRLARVEAQRNRGEVTLPTTIGEERATNPFMRAKSVDEFARLRTMKDSFG